MMKTSLMVLFSFLLCLSYAQDKQIIDNLKQKLNIAKQDTSRVQLMVLISYNYRFLNLDSSMYYGQQAFEIANRIDYLKGKVQAINRMAFCYRFTGNLPKALELSFKVLQLAENHPFEEEIALTLSAIGNAYLELEDFSKALSFFKKAKLVKENANQTTDILYCYVLMNIGTSFEETNQLDSAWYYFQKSLQVFEKNKIEIVPQLFRHFGNVQFKSGNMPLALDYYRKSLQATNTIKSQSALSAVLLALSEYYQKVNQPDSSIYYAKNALFEAQKISSKNSDIVAAALQLSKLYEKTNTSEAFRYYKIAIETKDRLYGKSSLEAIQAIADQEEERQKEMEASRILYQNQLKQYALLTGLGVFFLIAFILYLNNKKQKEANTLLYQQKEEINQKSKQLENTLTYLKSTQAQLIQSEKMASLGELTAGIAHEIQNPLNFVNNFSELSVDLSKELKEEVEKLEIPETDKEYVSEIIGDLSQNQEKINHHGKRASDIVKGMLEHSRKSTGEKESTDINALCDEYLRLAYQSMKAKDNDLPAGQASFNATMETHFDPNLPKIDIIPQDIGRVLLNLINNSFYAVNERSKKGETGYQPTVSITTQQTENKQIQIAVKDNGSGIPAHIKDKIFQPFFTTKPTGQGTGLGLSLSYDIVKAHGGELKVESSEGVGSEFILKMSL